MNVFRCWFTVGILSFTAFHARAEQWDVIAMSETDDAFYYDPTIIVKDGDKVTYWQLTNYAAPIAFGANKIYSSKTQILVNCKRHTYHMIYIFDYDKSFALGRIVNVDLTGNTPQYPTLPESIDAVIEGRICKG